MASWIPQGCMFRSSQYMEPCPFVFFLEFPLLAQSSHPFVVTDWINFKPSPIHMAWPRCWRLSWWELMSCSMDGKKQEKKAPGTDFLRPLWSPLFQRCFWKFFYQFLKQFLAYYSVSVWRAVSGWSRGWCNCSSSWAACGYRFADVRQQVRVTGQLLDIYPVLLSIGQTPPDECLCFWCDYWLWRELHLSSFQDCVLLQNILLWLVMTEGLSAI